MLRVRAKTRVIVYSPAVFIAALQQFACQGIGARARIVHLAPQLSAAAPTLAQPCLRPIPPLLVSSRPLGIVVVEREVVHLKNDGRFRKVEVVGARERERGCEHERELERGHRQG